MVKLWSHVESPQKPAYLWDRWAKWPGYFGIAHRLGPEFVWSSPGVVPRENCPGITRTMGSFLADLWKKNLCKGHTLTEDVMRHICIMYRYYLYYMTNSMIWVWMGDTPNSIHFSALCADKPLGLAHRDGPTSKLIKPSTLAHEATEMVWIPEMFSHQMIGQFWVILWLVLQPMLSKDLGHVRICAGRLDHC